MAQSSDDAVRQAPTISEVSASPEPGLAAFRMREPRRPRHLRNALEQVGFLGIGAVWYWLDLERNLADWDRLSVSQRFRLDAIRLDNNDFWVNQVAHPLAGAEYYAFARSNGYSVVTSTAFSFATSLAWEYGLEFQERTSYNDLLVTPGAGVALGEGLYRLGTYLGSGCSASPASVFHWTLGAPVAIHGTLDGASGCRGARDGLGLSAATFHEFRLRGEVGNVSARGVRPFSRMGVTTELVSIPAFASGKSQHGTFTQGEWTRTHLAVSGGAAAGVEFGGETALVGFQLRSVGVADETSVVLGSGLGFDYRALHFADFHDRWSALHLPGIASRLTWEGGPWAWAFRGSVTPDFVAANSLAYRVPDADIRGKSVMRKQRYYFGYGGSLSLETGVSFHGFEVGALAALNYVDSLEGLDRTQEDLSLDERASDTRERYRVYARVSGGAKDASLHAFAEVFRDVLFRRSSVDEHTQTRSAVTTGVTLGVSF